jgi:hypothetical protein
MNFVARLTQEARIVLDDAVLARRRPGEVPGVEEEDPHSVSV